MGLADDSLGWVADASGIFLTTDQGQNWRPITPPIFTGQYPSDRIDAMVGVGSTDLWLPVVDVIGLFPPARGEASDRFNGIEHSTDGGATWTFTALPGCLQACGADISLSFIDAQHGFALEGYVDGQRARLFSTDDGGAAWVPVGNLPDIGGLDIGSGQMAFSDARHGWVASGATTTYGQSGQITSSGGVLYRTTDGGATWSKAPGLPSDDRYGIPSFFGSRQGVVLGYPNDEPSQSALVFETDNSGATWTAHRLPPDRGLNDYHQNGIGTPFAAIGPASWKIDTGSAVYTTVDAGRTWSRSVPNPKSEPGSVSSVVFSSSTDGTAISLPPGCAAPVTVPNVNQCFPSLTVSTDGGSQWVPETP
jgi:photosystem II stability/assembly factor-like uncharacterized protein